MARLGLKVRYSKFKFRALFILLTPSSAPQMKRKYYFLFWIFDYSIFCSIPYRLGPCFPTPIKESDTIRYLLSVWQMNGISEMSEYIEWVDIPGKNLSVCICIGKYYVWKSFKMWPYMWGAYALHLSFLLIPDRYGRSKSSSYHIS